MGSAAVADLLVEDVQELLLPADGRLQLLVGHLIEVLRGVELHEALPLRLPAWLVLH